MQIDLNDSKYHVDYVKWAEIVIQKWEFNLVQKNLIYSGDLLRSFEQTVSSEAEGYKALISFAFLYYIRMLEMGVGKNAPLGADTTRRKYKVFTKRFMAELYRLNELLAEKYANRGAAMIVNKISD